MDEKEDYASDEDRDTRDTVSHIGQRRYQDPRIITVLLFAPPPRQVLLTEQSVMLGVAVEVVVDVVAVVLVAIRGAAWEATNVHPK